MGAEEGFQTRQRSPTITFADDSSLVGLKLVVLCRLCSFSFYHLSFNVLGCS